MLPLDLKTIAKSKSHEGIAATDLSSLPAMCAEMTKIPLSVLAGFEQLLDLFPRPFDQPASSSPTCLLDSLNAIYTACTVNSLELIAAFLSSHILNIHHALRLDPSNPGQLQEILVNTSKEITSFWQAYVTTTSTDHSGSTPDVSAHIQTQQPRRCKRHTSRPPGAMLVGLHLPSTSRCFPTKHSFWGTVQWA